MTSAQRGSASNLIYLCGPHHDVVDTQLEYHTREFLIAAKRTHEDAIARAVKSALGVVTFEELEVVCKVISGQQLETQAADVELAVPLQQKIDFNQLGASSVQQITSGLSQATRVESFITFQGQYEPSFGPTLVARFKSEYYRARADRLAPDEVFDYLVEVASENVGTHRTPSVLAAALAVVAYLFEICEIFERG